MKNFAKGQFPQLPGGYRPYESLWSVVHRFIWLNHPSAYDVMRLFRVSHDFYIDLRTGEPNGAPTSELARERFQRSFLSLTPSRFNSAVIPPYLSNKAIFRYCLSCVQQGYHSTIFFIPTLNECPAHEELLRNDCPFCGALISGTFCKSSLVAPYGCSNCGRSLILNDKAFFSALVPTGFHRIQRLGRWMSKLQESVVAWGDQSRSGWINPGLSRRLRVDKFIISTLTKCSSHSIPRACSFDFEALTVSERYSISACAIEGGKTESPRKILDWPERMYRSFLKYHSPRHTYQKYHSACRKAGYKTSPFNLIKSNPELMTETYAELFFCANCELVEFEKLLWEPTISVATKYAKVRRKFNTLMLRVRCSPYLFNYGDSRISNGKIPGTLINWIAGNVVMVEFSALYQEARAYAEAMVKEERIWPRPELYGILIPQFFTVRFDRENNVYVLEFWRVGGISQYLRIFVENWVKDMWGHEERRHAAVNTLILNPFP